MFDNESSNFDFVAHRDKAVGQFREVRGLYEDLAETSKRVLGDALAANGITVHSIEARAKALESFAIKAAKPSPSNSQEPKYKEPISEITDLAGIRVITFLPRVVNSVCDTIRTEFDVVEWRDKAEELMDEGKFGYQSIHFLVQMNSNRARLPEYRRFAGLTFEVQVRTILQHAWAEMEHDIQYKSASIIPSSIRRRFIALAGLLEIADREFQTLQDDDESMRVEARKSVELGHFDEIEITPDSLKAYLDQKLGPDGRQNIFGYNLTASHLKKLGFSTLAQVDECIRGYNDDQVSRILWRNRQGQLSRFEDTVLAAMGEAYIARHPWANDAYWSKRFPEKIEQLRKAGVSVGSYDPLSKSGAVDD